jgi:hypothetical protein
MTCFEDYFKKNTADILGKISGRGAAVKTLV